MYRLLATAFLGAIALAGCGTAVTIVNSPAANPPSAARVFLQDAGATGPVLLEVRDNPFREDVARPIAEAASHTALGFRTRFTTSPAEAAKPDFRMVVQFDPEPGASDLSVCDRGYPVGPPTVGARLTALVAFCHWNQPIAVLTAAAPRPEHADSPIIRDLTQQAMLRMFTPEGQDRDKPRRRLLGSL